MFRLEKVFQNDDKIFISISNLIKGFFIYILIYLFSILETHSVYEILNYNIYKNSIYFKLSLIVPTIFFFISIFLFKSTNSFYTHSKNILRKDLIKLFFSILVSFFLINLIENKINIHNFIFISFILSIGLFLIQIVITKSY